VSGGDEGELVRVANSGASGSVGSLYSPRLRRRRMFVILRPGLERGACRVPGLFVPSGRGVRYQQLSVHDAGVGSSCRGKGAASEGVV